MQATASSSGRTRAHKILRRAVDNSLRCGMLVALVGCSMKETYGGVTVVSPRAGETITVCQNQGGAVEGPCTTVSATGQAAAVEPGPALAVSSPRGALSLQSVNYPDLYLRFINFQGELGPVPAGEAERGDASFRLVSPGLEGPGTVSFESTSYPGHYLRHQDFRIKLARHDGSPLFLKDASFRPVAGLAGTGTSYQSVNYPDRFIRHRDFHLYLESGNGDLFRKDTTFLPRPALASLR